MEIWEWLADNILPAGILFIFALFYRKFENALEKVDEIAQQLTIFQIHMENTNKHIESIVDKMDKIDDHETRLVVVEKVQEECKAKHNEVEKRIRDLEYANAANTHR